jgi:hypothetical protein
MPTDTAPLDVTVRTAAPVPVITSGEVAIRAAVDPAIGQVLQGHFLLVDVLTTPGTPEQRCRNARTRASDDPVAWKYHRVGSTLLNDVLPPNHGQI